MMNFDPSGGPFVPPSDEEIARRNSVTPSKKRVFAKKFIIGVFIAFLAAAGVFGAIRLFGSKSKTSELPTAPTNSAVTNIPETNNDVPDATNTKAYENGPLGLKLIYPDSWKVTDTTDSGVRIESPSFSYTSLEKGDVTGLFRIYIRKGARQADGVIIGRGVAIQPSEKLVYSQPAPDQRKDTLLSLFGLDNKESFGFFLIAGNFQLNIGDTLGPNYGKEPDAFIVGGGFSADTLKGDLETYSVPISVIPTSKAYAQAIDIVKSLKLH